MKKIIPLLTAAGLLALFLFPTCKKSNTTPVSVTAAMSYSVDGATTTTTNVVCYIDTITVNGSASHIYYINSQAVQGTFPELTVSVVNPAAGTYTIGAYSAAGTTNGMFYVAASGAGTFYSVSGQLVITAVTSTSISGTFQANCTNTSVTPATSHTITAGTFTAPIAQ